MAIPPTPIHQKNITTFDNLAHHIDLGRRLIIVRHAERVDRCFNKTMGDWLHRMFPNKQTGTYCRINLNMPRRCPMRGTKEEEFNLLEYKSDTTLTTIGEGAAERLGTRILGSNLKIDKVYCSPALRCMQTCNRVLQGYCDIGKLDKKNFPMNIEPAIYDFTGFAESQLMIPTLPTGDFVTQRHFNINNTYKPTLVLDNLNAGENVSDFYPRIKQALDKIKEDTKNEPKSSILIVTHGPVMDGLCLTLLGHPPRTEAIFPKVANYPPYVACMILEENLAARDGKKDELQWRLAPPPVKSFTYLANPTFEWKKLTDRR